MNTFFQTNTPALAFSHRDKLADIAVLFGFELDIDELPELMTDTLSVIIINYSSVGRRDVIYSLC